MLKLTPIEETRVGQELIEQGESTILARLIARKFTQPIETARELLRPYDRDDFEALAEYPFEAQTFAEVEAWLAARNPQPEIVD